MKSMTRNGYLILQSGFTFLIFLVSCKKLVKIPPPVYSITTSQVYADSANASAGIAGIYFNMVSAGSLQFGNGGVSIYCGSSSDELVPFDGGSGDASDVYRNAIGPRNGVTSGSFWSNLYGILYQINTAIEAINASASLTTGVKNQLTGEAKFMRAYIYFYLTNFFGDVPLILGSDYHQNTIAPRTPVTQVYQQIVSDLNDAQNLLPADYSISRGEKVRANKPAATALLARVCLYTRDWNRADSCASSLINNSNFSLVDLKSVFLKNSPEAILQWQSNTSFFPYNATTEGDYLVPYDQTSPPHYYVNDQLVASFDPGDMRKVMWLDSTNYSGTVYYYPYKYKIGSALEVPGSDATEYYTLLRLGEQYLIRAEADAHGAGGGIVAAIADLNAIRSRAGLGNYAGATDLASVLDAIYHERRIELFAEWAHRWLDLKRTGQVDSVMTVATPLKNGGTLWNTSQKLYPIPYTELQLDPNLTQNEGY
jgi:hypothetical protein